MTSTQKALPDPLETAERWVREAGTLASPPDICIRVFDLLESESASAQSLGAVINRDPSLTARLLRLVNSAFYGRPRRIDTVSRAIAVIGTSELYNLVVAVAAVTSFSRIPNFIVNIDTFWRHGICCGLMARALARRCGVLHPERLFVAGVLHDVGSLLVYERAPETARTLLLEARGDESALARAERAALGFDHATLGGLLLDGWQLPQELVAAVRWHHAPAAAERGAFDAALVHIAEDFSNRCEHGAFYTSPATASAIDPSAWRITGLDPDTGLFEEIVEETRAQYRDALDLFTD